ncbi:MAG: TrkH family potassium uptake protein [Calditrichaeota bacterium]|nr:MAG: TrkH family potassium uptake protein [Calditrichota bacterium]
MHKTAVGYAIGKLMQILGGLLLVPLGIAIYDNFHEPLIEMLLFTEVFGFLFAIFFALLAGTVFIYIFKGGKKLQGVKEGYAIVTFGWIGLTFIGSIPILFWFMSSDPFAWQNFFLHFTDAYFEIMSGFTTTGSTIMSDIESAPRAILFLRALTHWLGGMGIITLALAIFPAMGVSGYQMFKGEVPGPTKERLQPRLAQTASILWGVYVLLSVAETVLLMIAGMDLFDAVCHTFATMATGGFSTENSSIAAYNSDLIEWIVIIFMYFAGINFLLHFKALRGNLNSLIKNKEFLFYTGVIVSTIIIVTIVLYFDGLKPANEAYEHFRYNKPTVEQFTEHYDEQAANFDSFNDIFRSAAFQTLAIVTTTGFATADFDLWPDFLRVLLVILMFFGGCAGSTAGGMKMIRIMLVLKFAVNELKKMTQPRLVSLVKIGKTSIEDKTLMNVVAFFILFILLFIMVAALMTLFVPDMTTAITCSIATIGNIGPGLAGVGSIENFGWIPIPGKWLLIFSMLLGRLEIFTVLIILRPHVWRK